MLHRRSREIIELCSIEMQTKEIQLAAGRAKTILYRFSPSGLFKGKTTAVSALVSSFSGSLELHIPYDVLEVQSSHRIPKPDDVASNKLAGRVRRKAACPHYNTMRGAPPAVESYHCADAT